VKASGLIPPTWEHSARELLRRGGRGQKIQGLIAGLLAMACAGCAAPIHRVATPRTSGPETDGPPRIVREATRPTVGVAFGGGSARGIAHVGVIRWLEEHRIPIDVAAGTSMGGLVGGAYATGMNADELQTFITTLNWDQLFGASAFAQKNIRRKTDARAYPARLEFGLRGGSYRQPPSTADRTWSCCSAALRHRTSTCGTSTTCRPPSEPSPWIFCRLSR
jgi:hypothetical protein